MLQNTLCAYQSLGGCERPLQGTQPWSRHLLSSADCKLFQQCPSADFPRDPAQSGISQQQAAPGGLSPIHSFHPDPWLSLCDGMESKRRACPAISFHEEWNSFSMPQRSWDSSLVTQLILKHRQKSLLRTPFSFTNEYLCLLFLHTVIIVLQQCHRSEV